MPVAIIMDFKDATLDQYDQVLEKMGLSPGGSGPPGALFHWATKTDNGFRVVDVGRVVSSSINSPTIRSALTRKRSV